MLRRSILRVALSWAFALVVGCGANSSPSNTEPLDDSGAPADDSSIADETLVFDSGGEGGLIVDLGVDDSGAIDGDTTGTGLTDAKPEVTGDACVPDAPKGAGPYPHKCAAATANECDGKSDINPTIPNGANGNGFDDDCDGQVDEGCVCDAAHPPGTTKDCYLVPASQVDPATKLPVGWCTANSKGTMACVQLGSGEFTGRVWDGYCKGAQPPFADDVCVPGDYDCDGLHSNSKSEDCSCAPPVVVTCPTDPIVVSPYPYPDDLTKKKPNPLDPKPTVPFIIDGFSWVGAGSTASTTNWKWTVTGGDCDNILPHPTFAIYNGANSTSATRLGTESSALGFGGKQHGLVTTASTPQHQIWPAFSLSGDYVVQGEFDLGGKHHVCTQKVQVRWPGVRAEMCWDTAGGAPGTATDVDLHLARLQGASCTGKHGWFDTCGTAPSSDDCYYTCQSGCRTGNKGFCAGGLITLPTPAPGWGYAVSTSDACHGWGSLREAGQSCDNPRLDRDNFACDPSVSDILNANFCGPENINVDDPNKGDQFAVGAHYYRGGPTPIFGTTTDATVHPHVNVYCNGERKLSLGYDPTTATPTTFPRETKAFDEVGTFVVGDFWEVARVTWSGDAASPCAIEPIKSAAFKADKDGSPNICVDTNAQNKAAAKKTDLWLFTPGGGYPTAPTAPVTAMCWH